MPVPRMICTFRELTRGRTVNPQHAFTFPINPESYQLQLGRQVEEVSIVGGEDIPRIGNRKLDKITFTACLPGTYNATLCNYAPIVPPGESYARLRRWATSGGGNAPLPLRVTIPGFYAGTMILTDANLSTKAADERSDIWVDISLMAWRELYARTWDYAAPARPSGPAGGTRYTIVSGDTLWGIARRHYGAGSEWRRIWDANKPMRSGNPNLIFPGETILIPRRG